MLDDILLDVEYNEDPHDSNHTKFLREEIAKWACILDIRECIHMAKEALVQHLKYPEKHK